MIAIVNVFHSKRIEGLTFFSNQKPDYVVFYVNVAFQKSIEYAKCYSEIFVNFNKQLCKEKMR